jgi:uncharacterized YigZ family protein
VLGSRFLAFIEPVSEGVQAKQFVAALARRHPDATHICFAWRIGWPPVERSADAGEPAGTAGAPILSALRSAELTDVVAAVVRWFGGTKLGKGGLVRAYGSIVRSALENLPSRPMVAGVRLVVRVPFDRVGALKRQIRPGAVELTDESYGTDGRLVFAVALAEREAFEAVLAELGLAAEPVATEE